MKLTTESIQLPQTYSIPEEAEQFRDALVESSKTITAITDATTLALAIAKGREIQAHLVEVEEARKALTAPALEYQRNLMRLSDNHVSPLRDQKFRLGALVSAWDLQEKKRIEELERIKQAEVERLESERRQAKLEAEKAAQVAAVSDDVATEIKAHNAQQAFEDADKASYTAMLAPIAPKVKAAGARTKTELDFEVTDIRALYAARPELCNPPEAKRSAIKATCTINSKIPGIRFFETTSTDFRR